MADTVLLLKSLTEFCIVTFLTLRFGSLYTRDIGSGGLHCVLYAVSVSHNIIRTIRNIRIITHIIRIITRIIRIILYYIIVSNSHFLSTIVVIVLLVKQ